MVHSFRATSSEHLGDVGCKKKLILLLAFPCLLVYYLTFLVVHDFLVNNTSVQRKRERDTNGTNFHPGDNPAAEEKINHICMVM